MAHVQIGNDNNPVWNGWGCYYRFVKEIVNVHIHDLRIFSPFDTEYVYCLWVLKVVLLSTGIPNSLILWCDDIILSIVMI